VSETVAAATPMQAGPGFARRFPVQYLPPKMREYAVDLAERKMVPVDLTAMFMLGIASGVIGPRFLVRRDWDWVEPTNLYVITGLRSGSAKSPVVKELTRGLGKAKKLLAEEHMAKLAQQQEGLDQQIEDCLRRANDITTPLDEKTGLKARAKELQREAEQLAQKPPRPPLTVVDGDTSPEALAERMAANGGYVSVIDDEGPLLRNLGGQYSGKTANLAVLLKGYDGQAYYPSRITRDASMMERAILSITISPQPALVAEMLRNTMMDETGLINRFFVSLPGDLLGKREGRPSTFIDDVPERNDTSLRDWWADILEALAGHDVLTGDMEEDVVRTIDLTRGAWKLHYEYQERFESRMDADRDGDLVRIVGWASKQCGRILRLAAVLHLLSGATTDDRIEEPTMRCAIGIGDWALEHFLHLGKVVGLSESASRIKEHILGKDMPWASRTEINVEVFRKGVHGDQLTAWINELVESGEFELVRKSGAGRPTWFVCKVGFRGVEPCAA
jgi:hypothetical protein